MTVLLIVLFVLSSPFTVLGMVHWWRNRDPKPKRSDPIQPVKFSQKL